MPNIRDVIIKVKENVQTEQSQKYMLCKLSPIDYENSCRVENRRNFYWVREYNNPSNAFVAYGPGTPDMINLPVRVTRNAQPPYFKRYIVEVDYSRLQPEDNPEVFEGHGPDHEWPDGAPGSDVFNTYPRSMYPMALRRVSGLTVYITPGIYKYRGQSYMFSGLQVNLALNLPSADKAVRILIYVMPESNVVNVLASAETIETIEPAYPLGYDNTIPVGWVKLLSDTTTITEELIGDPRAFISVNETPMWDDIQYMPENFTDEYAFHNNENEEYYALTAKSALDTEDLIPIEDSHDSWFKKKVLFEDFVSSIPGKQLVFTVEGELTVGSGTIGIGNHTGRTLTIDGVYLRVPTGSEPTGASIIIDVNDDGTTIFTNQANRPQIANGQAKGNTTTVDEASWLDNHYLTIDRDQVGSTTPGEDLTVTIVYH